MLEKFATCAPVTRFLTVQEMCRLRIGCEYSRRICNKRLFSKQLPINASSLSEVLRQMKLDLGRKPVSGALLIEPFGGNPLVRRMRKGSVLWIFYQLLNS